MHFITYSTLSRKLTHPTGRLTTVGFCAEESITLAKNSNERWVEALSTGALGRILGKGKSKYGKAEEYIKQGIQICDELKIRAYAAQLHLYLGELYADTNRREKALEELKSTSAMFQQMGMDYWLRRAQIVLDRIEELGVR